MSTPNLDDQVAALGISFIELAKMLGQKQLITVTQLANAIETSAQIARRPPAMSADFLAPLPDITHAVLAKIEDNVAILLPQ